MIIGVQMSREAHEFNRADTTLLQERALALEGWFAVSFVRFI
jgi:hypothetical protein